MKTRTARQWSVFYAYTAWSVVLIQAIFPLGVLLAFGTPVPALLAEAPAATAVLIVQMVVGAWSGHRALALWSAAALPEARDRWDLPQVGSIPADRSLIATAVPSAVIVLLQLLGLSAAPVLAASLTLLAAAALLRWRWQIGAALAAATTVIAMAFGLSAPVASHRRTAARRGAHGADVPVAGGDDARARRRPRGAGPARRRRGAAALRPRPARRHRAGPLRDR